MTVETPAAPDNEIDFAPLRLEQLKDLHNWLNRPHLRRFFQTRPTTLSEVIAKYGPAVRGEKPTRSHLAYLEGEPFAYLQCYRIADWPTWADLVESREGIGVDLAIVEPERLRKGLGRAILAAYLRDVAFPLHPGEHKCFIAHELKNRAAIACSCAVGFRFLRNFMEEGIATALFVLEHENRDTARG